MAPLVVVTPDLEPHGMRSLNDPTAQTALERILHETPEIKVVQIKVNPLKASKRASAKKKK